MLKKTDVLAAFAIGELTALILLGISKTIEILEEIPFLWLGCIIFPLLAVSGILIASFLAKKIPVIFQFTKFFLVGVSNTFIKLGILNLLMWVFAVFSGLTYSAFIALSFSFSIINSYFWNKFWTFQNGTKVSTREFSKFYLIAGIGFLLDIGIASLIVNVMGPQFGLSQEIWANIGAIIAICCVSLWSFLGYKFIIFKK